MGQLMNRTHTQVPKKGSWISAGIRLEITGLVISRNIAWEGDYDGISSGGPQRIDPKPYCVKHIDAGKEKGRRQGKMRVGREEKEGRAEDNKDK